MPSGVADYGADTWLGALVGLNALPSNYYVALCSDEPGAAMDGDILADLEPIGGGYSRKRLGIGAAYWEVGSGYLTTVNDTVFGTATAEWGLVSHYALCTQSSGGDLFAWGEIQNPLHIESGFFVSLPAGGIVLQLSALETPISV